MLTTNQPTNQPKQNQPPLPDCAGLRVRGFQGIPNVQQVECSGETLSPDTTVFSVLLYLQRKANVVASANLNSGECTTSASFSSCLLDPGNSRRSTVRTLVKDLREGESRLYGCEVVTLMSGSLIRSRIVHWSLVVRGTREWDLS